MPCQPYRKILCICGRCESSATRSLCCFQSRRICRFQTPSRSGETSIVDGKGVQSVSSSAICIFIYFLVYMFICLLVFFAFLFLFFCAKRNQCILKKWFILNYCCILPSCRPVPTRDHGLRPPQRVWCLPARPSVATVVPGPDVCCMLFFHCICKYVQMIIFVNVF